MVLQPLSPAQATLVPLPDLVEGSADTATVETTLPRKDLADITRAAERTLRYRYVHLDQSLVGDKAGPWPRLFDISLFDDVTVTVEISKSDRNNNLFLGNVVGVNGSFVTIARARQDKWLRVGIMAPGLGNFLIRPARRRGRAPTAEEPIHVVFEHGPLVFPDYPPNLPGEPGTTEAPEGDVIVDVLVVFTDSMQDFYSQDQFDCLAEEYVAKIQFVWDTVALPYEFRVAGAAALPVADGDFLSCKNLAAHAQYNNPYVSAARDGSGADLALVVHSGLLSAAGCVDTVLNTTYGNDSFFVMVVNETGHLFGAAHQGAGNGASATADAYSPDGVNATIMWNSTLQPRDTHPVFSDPLLFYDPLNPAGDDFHKNFEVVRDSGFNISEYRSGTQLDVHTVNVEGPGTVYADHGPIECPSSCSGDYLLGDRIELEAVPDTGAELTGWSGECFLDFPESVFADTYNLPGFPTEPCTATFTQETGEPGDYELTLTKHGDGEGTVTSEPAGISCGSSCTGDSGFFEPDSTVELHHQADDGFRFETWSGACGGGTVSPVQVTLTEDNLECGAEFVVDDGEPNEVTLTVQNLGEGAGTVETTDGKIVCLPQCDSASADYMASDPVTLLASPEDGHRFIGWSEGCGGTEQQLTFDIFTDRLCAATFAPEESIPDLEIKIFFDIFPESEPGNPWLEIDPGGHLCTSPAVCVENYPEGTDITVTAHGDENLAFEFLTCINLDADPDEDPVVFNSPLSPVTFQLEGKYQCLAQFACTGPDDGPEIGCE